MREKLNYSIYLEPFYEEISNYIEECINNISNENELRKNILTNLLNKYSRLVKSISILENNFLYEECHALTRELAEILFDIAYLESDKELYKRYSLFSYYDYYKKLEIKCELFGEDLKAINNINEIKEKYDEYKEKYGKSQDWKFLSTNDEVKKLDKIYNDNNISFEKIYTLIYRLDCLYTHNSFIVDNHYKEVEPHIYLDNISNVAIITSKLISTLPNIFKEKLDVLYEIDKMMGEYMDGK